MSRIHHHQSIRQMANGVEFDETRKSITSQSIVTFGTVWQEFISNFSDHFSANSPITPKIESVIISTATPSNLTNKLARYTSKHPLIISTRSHQFSSSRFSILKPHEIQVEITHDLHKHVALSTVQSSRNKLINWLADGRLPISVPAAASSQQRRSFYLLFRFLRFESLLVRWYFSEDSSFTGP